MRTFFVLAFLTVLLLATAAIGIEIAEATDPSLSNRLQNARTVVWAIATRGWDFARPLLQLITVFFILDWLATRLGFRIKLESLRGTWSVQTFIAGIIVITYCVAVLADIAAVNSLKDVVLIVIGFYFGTRAKVEQQDTVLPPTVPPPVPLTDDESKRNLAAGFNDDHR